MKTSGDFAECRQPRGSSLAAWLVNIIAPTRSVPAATSRSASGPIKLKLPRERVELSLHQREAKAIPGSSDRLFVRLGDITGGQVLVTIETDDDEVLLDEASLEQGEEARFRVSSREFSVRIKNLRNFLTGNDLAVIEVAEVREADASVDDSGTTVLRPRE